MGIDEIMKKKKENAACHLIAASGLPLENAGYLQPIIKKEEENVFEVGGKDFAISELNVLYEEEAAIEIEPVTLDTTVFTDETLRQTNTDSKHYAFGAYVFFFAPKLLESLGEDSIVNGLISRHKAIVVNPVLSKWQPYRFFLIDRDNLINGFIPDFMNLCRYLIEQILASRFISEKYNNSCLVSDEQDILAQLAQAMMNITDSDQKRLDEAIQYYGAMLLLSPLANNYTVWLDFVLSRWNHPIRDINHWKKMSFGVYDAVEANVCLKVRRNNIRQTILTRRSSKIFQQIPTDQFVYYKKSEPIPDITLAFMQPVFGSKEMINNTKEKRQDGDFGTLPDTINEMLPGYNIFDNQSISERTYCQDIHL
jgi:hypothetical protein